MSNPIGRSPGSVDPERPDASFNDDHVGGHVKLDEERAQRIRQSAGRYITPKRIQTEAKQVSGASAFRPAHREAAADALEREAKRRIALRGETVPQQQAQPPQRRDARMVRLERIEQRLTLLLGSMVRVQRQLAALEAGAQEGAEHVDEELISALLAEDELDEEGSDERGEDEQEPAAPAEPAQPDSGDAGAEALGRRLALLEQSAKFQLQLLIGGGQGLTLMSDPLLTFKRLFDQIEHWPERVRPGFRPSCAEEVDLFLAWVFEPVAAPGDLELLAELSGGK